ncbi:hypothetical protein D3C85_1545510 [compost metagenome]
MKLVLTVPIRPMRSVTAASADSRVNGSRRVPRAVSANSSRLLPPLPEAAATESETNTASNLAASAALATRTYSAKSWLACSGTSARRQAAMWWPVGRMKAFRASWRWLMGIPLGRQSGRHFRRRVVSLP